MTNTPADAIRLRALNIVLTQLRKMLKTDELQSFNLVKLGISKLDLVLLSTEVENELGITFPEGVIKLFTSATTTPQLVEIVSAALRIDHDKAVTATQTTWFGSRGILANWLGA
jgi:acyl carrier protein